MRHIRNPLSEKRSNAPKRCPPADSDINTGATSHTKAKPTATATAFCIYVIPL